MTERDPEFLSEDEAARLWARAAQLQAEQARREESPDEDSENTEPTEEEGDGYALVHVRSAALEAGIGSEFVDAALADVRAERAIPKVRWGRGLARRVLNDPPNAITVRRVIDAPAADVVLAMEAVFPGEPFHLALTDRHGDPLQGGLLVFDIQGNITWATEGFLGDANWANLRQAFVSIRPIDGPTPSCEVTMRGPVAWAHTMNAGIGGLATGLAGGVGLGVGSGAAAVVGAVGAGMGVGVMAAVVASILTVGGVVAGVGLGLVGFRSLYRYGLKRGEKAYGALLSAVAIRAQGGWGILGQRGASTASGQAPALPSAVLEGEEPIGEGGLAGA